MTLRPGWPAVSGAASQFDIRGGLRATVAQDAAGNVKTGVAVNAQTQSALVSARTDMKVDVAAFDAVLDRYGPVFVRHEGVDQVTLTAAPTANQRIDSVWVRQQETASPVSDAANGPLFGVSKGTASTSPVAPAIPAGAMRLADVQIPSTATATNSAGVTITQRYDFTASQGATLTFRTKTDLQAWAGWDGQKACVIADPTVANTGDYVSSAGVWVPLQGVCGGGVLTTVVPVRWIRVGNTVTLYGVVRMPDEWNGWSPTANNSACTLPFPPAATARATIWTQWNKGAVLNMNAGDTTATIGSGGTTSDWPGQKNEFYINGAAYLAG
jgi:hypothetical protein